MFCMQLVSLGVDQNGMFNLCRAAGFADAMSASSFPSWLKKQGIGSGVAGLPEEQLIDFDWGAVPGSPPD